MAIKNTQHLEVRLEQVLRHVDDAKRGKAKATVDLDDFREAEAYAPDKESELRDGIDQNYADSVEALLQESDTWLALAQSQDLVAHLDPFALLDNADLQRVNLLNTRVLDAVDSMPLADLAQRLTAIAAMGELPEQLLYLTHGERRLAEIAEGSEGRAEFAQAIDTLRSAAVHPRIAEAKALAAELRQAAAQVATAVA